MKTEFEAAEHRIDIDLIYQRLNRIQEPGLVCGYQVDDAFLNGNVFSGPIDNAKYNAKSERQRW